MLAPAGTPRPIVDALNGALQEAIRGSGHSQGLGRERHGAYPKEQRTPAGAAAYLKSEIAHWGQVVRDNKIEAPAN